MLLACRAASAVVAPVSPGCASDRDCSLNGVCSLEFECKCDPPWSGESCGMLAYKSTPASGRSLYPDSDTHNTWNGALIRGADGVFHMYNPLYPAGSLGGATTLMHGTASNITGPYKWPNGAYISIPSLGEFDGPKSVVYTESLNGTNKTKYSLWLGGHVYLADSAAGPFTMLEGFTYPGKNPAPLWHNGSFYTIASMSAGIYVTPRLVAGAKWTHYANISHQFVPEGWLPEDPDMWVDKRSNWHIINHAYSTTQWEHCSASLLSSHFFSTDGKTWNFLPGAIQPYGHTVEYDDGTSHMFVTIERPTMYFDEHGLLTHIHLAADLVTGDEGCGNRTKHANFGHTPCVNCKYGDHGGTTIIALETAIVDQTLVVV